MAEKKVSWKSQDGNHTIEVAVSSLFFNISIDGKWQGSDGMIHDLSSDAQAKFSQSGKIGIVATVGKIALTQEHKDLLLVTQNQVKAMPPDVDPLAEFYRLESALISARDGILTYNDRHGNGDPGRVYATEAKAERELKAWVDAHQGFEPYKQEMARRKAEKEKHEQELAQSFIARGLD